MFKRSRNVIAAEDRLKSLPLNLPIPEVAVLPAMAGKGRGGRGENINTSRFINKTAVNCSVEQFVPSA